MNTPGNTSLTGIAIFWSSMAKRIISTYYLTHLPRSIWLILWMRINPHLPEGCGRNSPGI